jgi:hypothetical protein
MRSLTRFSAVILQQRPPFLLAQDSLSCYFICATRVRSITSREVQSEIQVFCSKACEGTFELFEFPHVSEHSNFAHPTRT